MARFILFIALILIFYYAALVLIRNVLFRRKGMRTMPDAVELIQDPHCQTYIPKRTAVKGREAGKDYYFCSRKCLEGFRKKNRP